jgi:hypothetical protein
VRGDRGARVRYVCERCVRVRGEGITVMCKSEVLKHCVGG